MKKHPLISVAFLVHAVAWFLPVARDGVTFPEGLPGWQAFFFALLWSKGPPWWLGALSAMSALSTALFVLGAGWVVAMGSHIVRRVSAWIAACAFAVNAHWIVFSGKLGLRIGYYLWWGSFLLLAIGLLRLSRAPQSELQSQSDIAPS